jgi:ubiquinone/menaquinone biosynthesis C-methylase UbiE
MPDKTKAVISNRTLEGSHKRLVDFLKHNHNVLDIGCGTGSITSDIAKAVRTGSVIGIDENRGFIQQANTYFAHLTNLSFEVGDIYELGYENQFDVVTSARVLQWLAKPEQALKNMIKATTTGGHVIVLDYNHVKIQWNPAPPKSMIHFYDSFLQWRSDAGMDNSIADHLAAMFKRHGLQEVDVSIQHEISTKGDIDFEERLDLWAGVAESRGHQLVKDRYIDEHDRARAVTEYRQWMKDAADYMQMYLLAVSGRK